MDKLLSKLATVIVYLFLAANAIIVLGPVIWTVLASFKPGNNLFSSSFGEFAFTLITTKRCLKTHLICSGTKTLFYSPLRIC